MDQGKHPSPSCSSVSLEYSCLWLPTSLQEMELMHRTSRKKAVCREIAGPEGKKKIKASHFNTCLEIRGQSFRTERQKGNCPVTQAGCDWLLRSIYCL